MDLLTVKNISKKYGTDFLLNDISFTLAAGHKIAIAGETGSGKTTLMRITGGMGQADSGEVFFEGTHVWGIDEKLMAGHKGIAYLSQHFELPNKYHVAELLAYANDLTYEASEELYKVCDVAHLRHRWTHTLSGGEKQRVALARLLTTQPRLLLLDEPYSNLDLIHKTQLKKVIQNVGVQLGVTCMLISHDPADLLSWADEIFVMRQGNIVQRGTPQQIYQYPVSEYVAGLFGKYMVVSLSLVESLNLPVHAHQYLRPEDLAISRDKTKGTPAIVNRVLYFGDHIESEVIAEDQLLTIRTELKDLSTGSEVYIHVNT